ncbi:MAG: chromate transporter [Candidatus Gastranaerophilales bacterium]|nr:chromate transporter [Candidatus Gastranaerophilales bacterium]
MTYLLLFVEFFKIGLFSFGGGYATLPFLYHMSETYHWFSADELLRMLAVSSITPGPVGMNVATFAGFKTGGILGSIIATMAIMVPSFMIVIFISKMLKKFRDNFYIKSALYVLRPATAAMIAAVGVRLFKGSIILALPKGFSEFFDIFYKIGEFVDIKAFVLFLFLFILSLKLKRDPLVYLLIGAIFGVLLHFRHILNLL